MLPETPKKNLSSSLFSALLYFHPGSASWPKVKHTADRFLFIWRWHLSGDMTGMQSTIRSHPPSLFLHESDGRTAAPVTQLEFRTEKHWQMKKWVSGLLLVCAEFVSVFFVNVIFMLFKPLSDTLYSIDGGIVIREETSSLHLCGKICNLLYILEFMLKHSMVQQVMLCVHVYQSEKINLMKGDWNDLLNN